MLATRALRRAEGLDLSTMRIALNGAEPVDADAFRAFAAEAGRFGLPDAALFPAFGMAEVCIAGCFPMPGAGLVTDVVDGRVLEHEQYAAPVDAELAQRPRARRSSADRFPASRSASSTRSPAPCAATARWGSCRSRGDSLTAGYYRRPDATAELIVDGWLHTGDLAYTVEGEMVMCGRIKDVIIIGGRNIYPQDIEKVVGRMSTVCGPATSSRSARTAATRSSTSWSWPRPSSTIRGDLASRHRQHGHGGDRRAAS